MATYGVDPRNLVDTGDELRAATGAINRALDALNTAVNTYRATNSGDTADAFQKAQMQWQNGVDEMNANLAGGANALDDTAHVYHRTDVIGATSF